jgi:formimidoylglutamate deiminase
MRLLCGRLAIDDRFTAVHCTHTRGEDVAPFLRAGGRICMIPLTEADLGDGIADLPRILDSGGRERICLGTDSNHRISLTEEMRWLEYVQRLARQQRGVIVDGRGSSAAALWRMATVNGAASLGLAAGRMERESAADFLVVDLNHPAMAGSTPQTLLDAFIFGTGNEVIAATCVGGRWVGRCRPDGAGGSPPR